MSVSARLIVLIAALLAEIALCSQPTYAFSIPSRICFEKGSPAADVLAVDAPGQSRLEMMRIMQETGLTRSSAAVTLRLHPLPYTTSLCSMGSEVAPAVVPELSYMPVEQPLPATDTPDVFGSIALPISYTPLDRRWRSASRSGLTKNSGPWVSLLRSVTNQSRVTQMQAVNEWVNARVRFTDDRSDKLSSDRWSDASVTLRGQRGDCEDYAIAKMKLLEAAGVNRNDMYLVVVDDLVRRANHALLVVRQGSKLVVLDNSTDQMLDAHDVSDYRPIFSYSAAGAWIYGHVEAAAKVSII